MQPTVSMAASCAGCVCACAGHAVHIGDEHEQSAVLTLSKLDIPALGSASSVWCAGHEVDVVTCWREKGQCLVAAADR